MTTTGIKDFAVEATAEGLRGRGPVLASAQGDALGDAPESAVPVAVGGDADMRAIDLDLLD